MPSQPSRVVRSPGVVIRQLAVSDAVIVSELVEANLDHIAPWMQWAEYEPLSIQDRRELIAGWNESGDHSFGIYVDKNADESVLVGICGLIHRVGPGGVEVGYWLAGSHQGHGYMTEAVKLLTTVAFGDGTIDFVEIRHDKANTASAAIPRRVGYSFIDESPDEIEAPGEVGISCTWRMTRTQWNKRRTAQR